MRFKRGLTVSTSTRTGVLLVNLGTPEAASTGAVRRYLGEFLHDHRVVELTRWLWCWILHGVVLRIRPKRSAAAYAKIWGDSGSPLMAHTKEMSAQLATLLTTENRESVHVAMAMRYGEPSVHSVMTHLANEGISRLVVLPLYPQFSCSTSASVFDAVNDVLKSWRNLPSTHLIRDYHCHHGYLDALTQSVHEHWAKHPRGEKLIMSFHGTPQRYADQGDPYYEQCHATAKALADRLALNPDEWMLTFQSRFGKAPWLTPYTDKTLEALPASGTKSVDIICPGFAADCLETLEEIAEENAEIFEEAGGNGFSYIPCLNARQDHIKALSEVIRQDVPGWFAT